VQKPAEKELVRRLADFLNQAPDGNGPSAILNIGAGRDAWIEKQLSTLACRFVCDRMDAEDCRADAPSVRTCWQGSVEAMTQAGNGAYAAAFANYVLEHVRDLHAAAREIHRILMPSGLFIASVPNAAAPEFLIARCTPLWLHKMVRRAEAWETYYAYSGIPALIDVFVARGFVLDGVRYWPFTQAYVGGYPILGHLSRFYDRLVARSAHDRLKGDVCVAFKKAPAGT
jgi:SAM-dependent methyltransferase